jgi:prolyl 4-hydroxylase
MYVKRIHTDPEVLFLTGFVSEAEARGLMLAANGHFDRSSTVCATPGGCPHAERSSSSAGIPESALTRALQERGRIFSGAPTAEPIQVVRYGPEQEYRPHHDAFDESVGGQQARRMHGGGQREATILIYLRCPEEGGETVFPELGLSVAPVPQAALFWRNTHRDGSVDRRLLHGGAPVRRGAKYAANLWLRAHPKLIWP